MVPIYNSTTRHLKYSYISILANLLRTDNETKGVKTRQTSKTEISAKTVKGIQSLTVFVKNSIP